MPPDADASTFIASLQQLAEAAHAHVPTWLEPVQAGARRRLPQLELPDRGTERWKYTSVRSLLGTRWQPPPAAAAPPAPAALADYLAGAHATVVNGLCVSLQDAPPGVEINAFGNLSASQQVLVCDLLDRRAYAHYAFADVNSALLRDGVFVHVHANATHTPTIVVNQALAGDGTFLAQPRLLVLLDPGARARLVEINHAPVGTSAARNTVTEIQLGRDAQLEHACVQLEPDTVSAIVGCEVRLGGGARYQHQAVLTGGTLRRCDLTIASAAVGAEVEVDALLLADGRQHVDLHLDLEHAHPRGGSNARVNALAAERARVVFNGRIHIHPGACGTSAHLHNRNLCLSSNAQVNTKPELEIYNDDVQCSHGATVGSLDPASLFYLRSRGISEQRAHALLVTAFTDERITALANHGEALVEGVRALVHGRLAQTLT